MGRHFEQQQNIVALIIKKNQACPIVGESVREYPRPFESIPPLEICECRRVFKSVWRYPGPFEIIRLSDTIRDLQVSESFREYPRPFTPNFQTVKYLEMKHLCS